MKYQIEKLKKYLFMISIVFFVIALIHLIWLFLYHDSELEAVPGGSISEGIIGNFPHLNPLKGGTDNDKYIISLLYRSLLKYDIETGKIISDLASCDVSNISYVECYLKDDIYWSNGTPITTADIVSTYTILKNTQTNPIISSLLQDTTIEQSDSVIIFTNTQEDINYLNIFFQPIAPKDLLDNLGEAQISSNFSGIDEVYSGQYVIKNISQDQTIGITKIILEKNTEFRDNPILIDQLVLKIFPSTHTFLKNKESVNIFNDTNHILSNSIPRLEPYQYILPQHVSLFLNKENISSTQLRSNILSAIDTSQLLQELGVNNFTAVENPYLSQSKITGPLNTIDTASIMEELGYYTKDKIIADFKKNFKVNNIISDEVNTINQTEVVKISDVENIGDVEVLRDIAFLESIDDFQKPSVSIQEPDYIERYNFVTQDDILLKGRVLEGTQAVYVNDYKLRGFQPGNTIFAYRIREAFNNISIGDNTYTIYFELPQPDGRLEKRKIEDISLYYNSNSQELEQAKQDLFEKLKTAEIQKQEAFKKQKELAEQEDNRIQQEDIEYISQINALNELDDTLYYNENGEIFSLNFYYVDTEKNLEKTAEYIAQELKNIGIQLNLFPVSLNGLVAILNNKNDYDMVLAGVHLGYFDENIFPYLHSSQVKSGYNFSQIRKTSLDILLEELKSNIVEPERVKEIQEKIIEILSEEQIIKTLYTPNLYLLVDKKIKNISFPAYVPFSSLRANVLNNIYIQEKKYIQFENKSFGEFFSFLVKKIYE